MKHVLKGFAVVIIVGGIFFVGWKIFENRLTAGMRPSESTQKLNELELKGVPLFSLKDLSGRDVSLDQFRDRVVILSFWASWCDPCVAEFPSMIRLVEFFQGKVVMLAISADHSDQDIRDFLRNFPGAENPNIVVMWDKQQAVASKFGTEVLPEAYIIGKGLKLVRKVAGSEDWFSPGAVELFQQLTQH